MDADSAWNHQFSIYVKSGVSQGFDQPRVGRDGFWEVWTVWEVQESSGMRCSGVKSESTEYAERAGHYGIAMLFFSNSHSCIENSEICEEKARTNINVRMSQDFHGIPPVVPTVAFYSDDDTSHTRYAQEDNQSAKCSCHDFLVLSATIFKPLWEMHMKGYINATWIFFQEHCLAKIRSIFSMNSSHGMAKSCLDLSAPTFVHGFRF